MRYLNSKLKLSFGPLTVFEFDAYREDKEIYNELSQTSIYVIAKRALPLMEIKEASSDRFLFRIFMEDEKNNLYMEFKKSKNSNLFMNGIEQIRTGTNIMNQNKIFHSVQFYRENEEFVLAANFDRFNQLDYNEKIEVDYFSENKDSLLPFITYEVLYVGHCANQHIYKRFNSHHAIQKILIRENILPANYDKCNELIILPFHLENEEITIISPTCKLKESDLDVITYEDIVFDCEKALIRALDPKYNVTKFKSYPKSRDGLSRFDLKAYTFIIDERIILSYDNGKEIRGNICEDNSIIAISDNEEFEILSVSNE